jgi:excisionase family DNA binding protein
VFTQRIILSQEPCFGLRCRGSMAQIVGVGKRPGGERPVDSASPSAGTARARIGALPAVSGASAVMTTLQAARRLGVSPTTAQFMVERGELQAWKTSGGHRRITVDSVEYLIGFRASGRPKAGSPDDGVLRVLVLAEDRLAKACATAIQRRGVALEVLPGFGLASALAIERGRPDVVVVDVRQAPEARALVRQLREQPEYRSVLILCVAARTSAEALAGKLPGVVVFSEASVRSRLTGFIDALVVSRQFASPSRMRAPAPG